MSSAETPVAPAVAETPAVAPAETPAAAPVETPAVPTPTTQYEIGKLYKITSKVKNMYKNIPTDENGITSLFEKEKVGKDASQHTEYASLENFKAYLETDTTKSANLIKINNLGMHFEIIYGWDITFIDNKYNVLIVKPEQLTTGEYKIEKSNSGGKKSRAKKNTRKSRRNRKSKRYNRRR